MLAYVNALYPLGARGWEISQIISLPQSNDLQARDAGDTELSDSYQKTF